MKTTFILNNVRISPKTHRICDCFVSGPTPYTYLHLYREGQSLKVNLAFEPPILPEERTRVSNLASLMTPVMQEAWTGWIDFMLSLIGIPHNSSAEAFDQMDGLLRSMLSN